MPSKTSCFREDQVSWCANLWNRVSCAHDGGWPRPRWLTPGPPRIAGWRPIPATAACAWPVSGYRRRTPRRAWSSKKVARRSRTPRRRRVSRRKRLLLPRSPFPVADDLGRRYIGFDQLDSDVGNTPEGDFEHAGILSLYGFTPVGT